MDGNKIVIAILFTGIITLAITACKVQPSGYGSLFVENYTLVNDNISFDDPLMNIKEDSSASHLMDKSAINMKELLGFLQTQKDNFKISFDSTYQQEVKELLMSIMESIQLLSCQITELQNRNIIKTDTIFIDKSKHIDQSTDNLTSELKYKQVLHKRSDTITILSNQVNEVKDYARLKSDSASMHNEIKRQHEDSIIRDFQTKQLLNPK